MASVLNFATLSAFIVCCLHLSTANAGCQVPPRFWCENKETAAKCGVLEQCQQYEWSQSDQKVEFELYFESMCPDCQDFISNTLAPSYPNISDIINITLVPYGNARMTKDGDQWKFECQHGPDECLGNIIETCSIAILQDFDKYFNFITCIEGSTTWMDPSSAAQECAGQQQVDFGKIYECAKSARGNQLEHDMAVKTNNLQPPHTFVPWVTLNGVHTDKIQKEAEQHFVQLICETYKGSKKPAACSGSK